MTEHERRLAYFHTFEKEILELLRITQPAETLSDEERVGLTNAYLEIMAS